MTDVNSQTVQHIIASLKAAATATDRPTLTWSPDDPVPFVELHFLEVAGIIDYYADGPRTVAELTPTGLSVLSETALDF